MKDNRCERYGDLRLSEWGKWAKHTSEGMGWPKETLLSRVIRYGERGAAQPGKPPTIIPEAIAEVDRIVCKMPKHIRIAVCEHYTTYAPSETKAKKLKISRSVFWSRIKAGQWFVYAALSVAVA